MAKTIDDCLGAVRTALDGISTLRAVPTGIPEHTGGVFPFAVAWEGPGEFYRESFDTTRKLFSIVVQVHFSRRGLYQAEIQATPIGESVLTALLADPTFGGTCETFARITHNGFQALTWGEPAIQTVGYEYRITGIKIRPAEMATST